MRLTRTQQALEPGELILLHLGVPGSDPFDGLVLVAVIAGQGLGLHQQHAVELDTRQRFGVIRLGQVLNVVQAPAKKAIAPVGMPRGEGQARQTQVLIGPPVRPVTLQKAGCGVHHRALMEKAHVERRLGAVLETRIAKRLRAEAVQCGHVTWIVAEQVDVVAVVRLVGGAGEHRHGRYLFPGRQADETLLVPG
ncbi:hypothetical protein D3C78_920580 [compost metagenome]